MEPEFKGTRYFLMIPASVAHDNSLKPIDKLLFGEIYSMLNVTGKFYMSNKEIAKRLDCTERYVRSRIEILEKAGYLNREMLKDETGAIVGRIITASKWPNQRNNNSGGRGSTKPEGEDTQNRRGEEPQNPQIDHLLIEQSGREQVAPLTPQRGEGKKPDDQFKRGVTEVIDYLNQKAGTKYRATTAATKRLVGARLKEGFTVDDCKKVIDNKVADWLTDEKMKNYLRPNTLFQASKFESYLNETPKKSWKQQEDERYKNPFDYER